MRILFAGARDDERPALEEWRSAHPEHEVVATSEILSPEMAPLLDSIDAVCTQQIIEIDAALLEELSARGITQISSRTAGVDMIDLATARKHGITVTNVPSYSPNAIAEFALASTLHLTRRFPLILERSAERDFRFAGMIGRELRTMRVAIIGTGLIGRITARHFKNLGSEVVGFDLYPNDEFTTIGTYAASFEDAIKGADIVSLHVPLTTDNHHMFGAEQMALMNKGGILVNAGRGGLVNTQALLASLDAGHLAGAALDVYENEAQYFRFDWRNKDLGDPLLERLLEHPQVLVTPHVAFYTETAVHALVTQGLDNAVLVREGGTCRSAVN